MRRDRKVRDNEAKFKFVSSTRFPCQENEVITTIQETETTEGNRLLTWLYWTTSHRETCSKSVLKKREKNSKEPANSNDEDCSDDED